MARKRKVSQKKSQKKVKKEITNIFDSIPSHIFEEIIFPFFDTKSFVSLGSTCHVAYKITYDYNINIRALKLIYFTRYLKDNGKFIYNFMETLRKEIQIQTYSDADYTWSKYPQLHPYISRSNTSVYESFRKGRNRKISQVCLVCDAQQKIQIEYFGRDSLGYAYPEIVIYKSSQRYFLISDSVISPQISLSELCADLKVPIELSIDLLECILNLISRGLFGTLPIAFKKKFSRDWTKNYKWNSTYYELRDFYGTQRNEWDNWIDEDFKKILVNHAFIKKKKFKLINN